MSDALDEKVSELLKCGDVVAALETAGTINDKGHQHWAYLRIVAHQVRVGDLTGGKRTVAQAPVLWTGGHWVRCLLIPLVTTGDVAGALEVVNLLVPEQRGFHMAVVTALQVRAGDIEGAERTIGTVPRGKGTQDRALETIVEGHARMNNFTAALKTAFRLESTEKRQTAIATIIAAQSVSQGTTAAEESLEAICDGIFRQDLRESLNELLTHKYTPIDRLSISRLTLSLGDTFDTLYPEEQLH